MYTEPTKEMENDEDGDSVSTKQSLYRATLLDPPNPTNESFHPQNDPSDVPFWSGCFSSDICFLKEESEKEGCVLVTTTPFFKVYVYCSNNTDVTDLVALPLLHTWLRFVGPRPPQNLDPGWRTAWPFIFIDHLHCACTAQMDNENAFSRSSSLKIEGLARGGPSVARKEI
jgi:hypothetical protein